MSPEEYDVVIHDEYGYARLDPIPDDETLSEFYQSEYPELLSDGELGEDVSRLLRDTENATREREWRRSTWYTDCLSIACDIDSGAERVLDIGCGTGEFLSFAEERGYDAVGVEPSGRLADAAREKDLEVYDGTVEAFVDEHDQRFDLITLFNVLEHVPNPAEVFQAVRSLLTDDGVVVVKVPNEFNPLQVAAKELLDLEHWWITAPTHIYYFDFESLGTLMTDLGFDVRESMADFPMSMFLLMGDNYVKDDEVGTVCHERRVAFERALEPDVRRRFYTQLADAGFGRNCTLFGTVSSQEN